MNYRHAFHAGNFADVVKHAVLARVLVHLCQKPGAFRVIDTHAGAGLYDLAVAEATRALLAPYLDIVAALNAGSQLREYPGSPAIVRAFLRPQDRLIACE